MSHRLPNRPPPADNEPHTTHSRISASDDARQHNGDVINHYSNTYSLGQRRSDETLREDQRSPLLLEAAADGQTIRINYLLRLGVNIDYRDKYGFTALHHAALSGFEDTVLALLDAGADINASSPTIGTPLCLAALKARLSICTLLLSRRSRTAGERLSDVTPLLQSALHCAVIGNDLDCVRLLLDHGCGINTQCMIDDAEKGPAAGDLPGVLLTFCREEHRRGKWFLALQPLHLAVVARNLGVVDFLVAAGATIDERIILPDLAGNPTPLMVAASCGYADVVEALLSHGTDSSFKATPYSVTALMYATGSGHIDCIETLLRSNVDIDSISSDCGTALHLAISQEVVDAASLLIRKGAAHDIADLFGHTPLDLAIVHKLDDVAHQLARKGAAFRKQDNSYSLVNLWNVDSFEYRTFGMFKHGVKLPPYAALTHRWMEAEIKFGDLTQLSVEQRKAQVAAHESESSRVSWAKIQQFLHQCRVSGLKWAWADSMSIPQEQMSKYREGHTCVFKLYGGAMRHFVLLDDIFVDVKQDISRHLSKSRILKRSWTLPQLLANDSNSTMFFDADWRFMGSRATLATELSEAMSIRTEYLHDLRKACVATKLSWGANLEAAAPEDKVYALCDIVGVPLSFLHGEGELNALRRLQEEIIDTLNDESILAWQLAKDSLGIPGYEDCHLGLLAPSLACFRSCWNLDIKPGHRRVRLLRHQDRSPKGVEITAPLEDPCHIEIRSVQRFRGGHVTLRCFDRERGSVNACISFNVRQPEGMVDSWQRQGSLVLQRWTPIERSWIPKFKRTAKPEALFFPQEPVTGG